MVQILCDQVILITTTWLRDELFECPGSLYQCDFNVCAIAFDNHQSTVQRLKNYWGDATKIETNYQCKNIYLFYDSVHLIKNIRNNPLSCKKSLYFHFLLSMDSEILENMP